jgi:hypothetical protein
VTPLRPVGFFRELRHGLPDGPSLREAMRDESDPFEAPVIAYLRGAATLVTTGRMAQDVLAHVSDIAPLATLTDGEWMWPADLAYYVETYHVRLPAEFLEHAAAHGWQAPKLTSHQLTEAAKRARSAH